MGRETAISWCDHTFNPWIGCAKVSKACDGCYAEALMGTTGRHKRALWGGPGVGVGTRDRTAPGTWRQPLTWNGAAKRDGTRPFVFCASLADVFDNAVPPQWRADLFELIRATPHLVWLLLTKRPQNIRRLFLDISPDRDWPANAAMGCTVVTQAEADRDLDILKDAKAALKPAFAFVSIEPMLEEINRLTWLATHPAESCLQAYAGLDWVIAGGETDQGAHRARPSHPDWFRALRDQCAAGGVPFHFKQHGEWAPICWMSEDLSEAIYRPAPARDPEASRRCLVSNTVMHRDGALFADPADWAAFAGGKGAMTMFKVGKARSGRLIDGVVHDARPEAPRHG